MFQIIREPEFSRRVTERREKVDLSQSDCARAMRVSRQMWNNWETGYCKPKGGKLVRMAKVLKCDSFWLEHGNDDTLPVRMIRAMRMMRDATRELEHIYDALLKRTEGLREEKAK